MPRAPVHARSALVPDLRDPAAAVRKPPLRREPRHLAVDRNQQTFAPLLVGHPCFPGCGDDPASNRAAPVFDPDGAEQAIGASALPSFAQFERGREGFFNSLLALDPWG